MKFPKLPSKVEDYLDLKVALIFVGWIAFQAVLAMLPVGRVVEGQPLRTGKKLKYRLNGRLCAVSSFRTALYVLFVYPLYINYTDFYCYDNLH